MMDKSLTKGKKKKNDAGNATVRLACSALATAPNVSAEEKETNCLKSKKKLKISALNSAQKRGWDENLVPEIYFYLTKQGDVLVACLVFCS
ncbi:hypothetical protein KA089_01880 [Candidatus Woesebacteria bacterium]|nr:hypothetical protein [Candidatus Woesebacteria bacterium]